MKTHDFTQCGWGYNVEVVRDEFKDGSMLYVCGCGAHLEPGDELLLKNVNGGTNRYSVSDIERRSNPQDMWFAHLEFMPVRDQDTLPS